MGASDRSRPPYADLLERYRKEDGRSWYEVDVAAGVNSRTREQWLSGLVRNPPLVGVVRVANELGVPPEELFELALDEEVQSSGAAHRANLEQRLATLEATVAQLREVQGSAEGRELYARWQEARAAELRREVQGRREDEGTPGS